MKCMQAHASLQTHPPTLQEVHDSLLSIEGEAMRIAGSERALLDSDAQERDRLYERAESVSSALLMLGTQLHSTVGDVNAVSSSTLGDSAGPVASIVRILNNQLQALSQVGWGFILGGAYKCRLSAVMPEWPVATTMYSNSQSCKSTSTHQEQCPIAGLHAFVCVVQARLLQQWQD